MTMRTCATALFLACGLLACGQPNDKTQPAAVVDATRPEADEHMEDANTLEVDEGMLRDLRITTSGVESRPGGERVVLLGSLAVDQSAYAEVGAPVAARVTRLHINAGDTVSRGQVLADLTSPELARQRAEYLSARARLTLAEAALERKRGLAAEKIAP